jgi:Uncharacterised protein family (UPF0236)
MKPDPDLERLVDATLAKLREKMLKELHDSGATHGTLDQIEDAVARLGDEFRRTFQEQVVSQRTKTPRDNQVDCACGHRARFHALRTRLLLTRHGELRLTRPYYYCHACQRGFAPLDAALGLSSASATATLQCWMAELAARLPFQEATGVLSRLTGVGVSPALLERTAVGVGRALRTQQQAEAASHHAGRPPTVLRKPQRLYISIDGLFVPLRDPWKRDGSAGSLLCRWGECKTAVIYEARPTDQGDEGVARASYIASLEDVKAFTPLVSTLAHRWGHHFAREVVVLADGAPWIWNLAATQFPTALQILDFFHVSEYLYRVAHAFFGEGSCEAKEWVKARQEELKRNRLSQVLWRLRRLEARGGEQEKVRATVIGYFEENRERMRYGTYLAKGYQIASGVMEASCKHVVGQRLDQAGMHWRPEAAEAVLALRAALLSTHPPDLRPYCHRSRLLLPHS